MKSSGLYKIIGERGISHLRGTGKNPWTFAGRQNANAEAIAMLPEYVPIMLTLLATSETHKTVYLRLRHPSKLAEPIPLRFQVFPSAHQVSAMRN
jgi:hypothetical protein